MKIMSVYMLKAKEVVAKNKKVVDSKRKYFIFFAFYSAYLIYNFGAFLIEREFNDFLLFAIVLSSFLMFSISFLGIFFPKLFEKKKEGNNK